MATRAAKAQVANSEIREDLERLALIFDKHDTLEEWFDAECAALGSTVDKWCRYVSGLAPQ